MREAEELDERDEDDEDNSVPVENESYVNLKKRMNKKHHLKIDNLIQENRKLCREFQKKEVNNFSSPLTILLYLLSSTVFLLSFLSLPVIPALQVHAGPEEEAASLE